MYIIKKNLINNIDMSLFSSEYRSKQFSNVDIYKNLRLHNLEKQSESSTILSIDENKKVKLIDPSESVDLTNYYTKPETNTLFYNKNYIDTNVYYKNVLYTKTETDDKFPTKEELIEGYYSKLQSDYYYYKKEQL
jgi:hypothetical protein